LFCSGCRWGPYRCCPGGQRRLITVGDEGKAELLRKPGDRLVIVADDEGNVGEGLRRYRSTILDISTETPRPAIHWQCTSQICLRSSPAFSMKQLETDQLEMLWQWPKAFFSSSKRRSRSSWPRCRM
jgi:hypothetical protein